MTADKFLLDIIFVNNSWKDGGHFPSALTDEVSTGMGWKNK